MIIVNGVGFLMFVVACGLAAGLLALLGSESSLAGGFLAMGLSIFIDLAYRELRKIKLFGRGGGTVFFLPLWLISTLVVLANLGRVFWK